jgi:NADH:ubiquinone oxidoreductase subunit H
MIAIALAIVSLSVFAAALVGAAAIERTTRLSGVAYRAEGLPPKAEWSNLRAPAPANYGAARALASAARLARPRSVVEGASSAMRRSSRTLSLFATASALSIVPFAATWRGASDGHPLVAVDLEYGLGVLVFLILLSGLAQAATGLAERSLWARLGALRVVGQSLMGVALLLLVLAPLILTTQTLRPHDLVAFQQGTFAPLALLAEAFLSDAAGGSGRVVGLDLGALESIRIPNWFVLRQPLTAILIVPTLGLLLQRYSVYDTMSNTSGMSGFGLDSDTSDLSWMGIESRLSSVLAAAIFVAFFLGAGSIPYFDARPLLALAQPWLGDGLPAALLVVAEAGVFAVKMLAVLYLASHLRRAAGRARTDQSLHTMTRRLMPLAWANLLLISALSLLESQASAALR